MSNSIRTYKELVAYQQELRELMLVHKQVIRQDIREIKSELKPVTNVVGLISKFFIRNKIHTTAARTVSSLIDLVLKKTILSRASWPSRVVVPFLTRNILSHLLVPEQREQLLNKLHAIISHKKKGNKM